MRVLITYNEPEKGRLDSEDVLDQVILVASCIDALGWKHSKFPASTGNIGGFQHAVSTFRPDVVFNLVEELGGKSGLQPVFAGLYEAMGLPYTGTPYWGLISAADKRLTKMLLQNARIKTPDWITYNGGSITVDIPPPYIVKPSLEHASMGIDDGNVFYEKSELAERLPYIYEKNGRQPLLIERFIEGREVNVSMLEKEGRVEVFPLAEILFNNWPTDKPKIVNYAAKWLEESFDYENTPRTFDIKGLPESVIRKAAISSWGAFSLGGYARADMRVDDGGEVYVMEINPNPCISPGAGYIAASKEAGYSKEDLISIIIKSAINKHRSK